MEKVYDIAIVGRGPAGLSAALNCYARNKDFVIVGPKSGSDKLLSTSQVDNYLGLSPATGEEINETFLSTIEKYELNNIDASVSSVYSLPDGFFLELKDSTMVQARSVIVATGLSSKTTIKGENRFIGKGISSCATCDGNLYRDKNLVVLAYSESAIEEANFLVDIVRSMTLIDLIGIADRLDPRIKLLDAKPLEFVGDKYAEVLVTDKGELKADGFFVIRDDKAASDIIPGIELEDKHIKVDKDFATNIPGLYACGDVCGSPYQIAKAVGEGNIAALSASKFIELSKLNKLKR